MFARLCLIVIFSFIASTSADEPNLEKFKAIREKMLANLPVIDDVISKLSDAAQGPAKKFRELLLTTEQDPAKIRAEAEAIRDSLSKEVRDELAVYRTNIHNKLGIEMPQ